MSETNPEEWMRNDGKADEISPVPRDCFDETANGFLRRILICVTGLTPQVVTETLYALVTTKPGWQPTEVHVLTTITGANLAKSLLLPDGQGHFARLCQDYDLKDIAFDDSQIHVLADSQGHPLDDIRSPADNMAMADAIVAKIAEFAADPNCAIHVSLAGGRKSMGFFAGYALSLYGRPQDRLSHVLVSAGFETNPEFFYPPPVARELIGRNGERLSTADACIDLAEIPFVRLRDRLPENLLAGGRFADAVAAAQQLETPHLRVELSKRRIVCGNESIKLSPVKFAIYAWYAQRCLDLSQPEVDLSTFNAVASPLRRELSAFGRRLYDNPMSSEAQRWEECNWDADDIDFSQWLSEKRARINETIRKSLAKAGERVYGIASVQVKGRRHCHRLRLDRDCVEIVP